MNHKFLFGLTVVFMLSGAKVVASELEKNSLLGQQLPQQQAPSEVEVKKTPTKSEEAVTIYPHRMEKYEAATLYLKGIPAITFLGTAKNAEEEPVGRAQKLAARLKQLLAEKADANKIGVSWNSESKSYSIKIDKEELVRIDEKTILPDTTGKSSQDALQATNRLRRLMGEAAPLQTIAGAPAAPQKVSRAPMAKPVTAKPAKSKAVATRVTGQFRGMASWYGKEFHGRRTASGERYNQYALTAAHRSLPFGTLVRVTNVNNGRSVVVRITDRGPFTGGRIIDLSAGAAQAIGMIGSGVAPVRVEVLSR